MQRRQVAVLCCGMTMLTSPMWAADCASKLPSKPSASDFIACLVEIQGENQQLRDAIDNLPKPTVIPSGTVIAATRDCRSLGVGWTSYEDGAGKFILGAGSGTLRYRGPHRPANIAAEVNLTQVQLQDQGGEETHALVTSELPAHSHDFVGLNIPIYGYGNQSVKDDNMHNLAVGHPSVAMGNFTPSGTITATGGDATHNNMPPFIALHFCVFGG